MKSGLLLIGHGTRDSVGTDEFFELARCLANHVSPTPVEPALLEFQEPTIPQAWSRLVAAGVEHVHVAPLLLFAAGHAKQDIPEIIRTCHEQTPFVTWSQSRPLSRHPALIKLAIEKAREAISKHQLDSTSLGFVVVGRGSYDPCAQADTRVLAAILGYHLELSPCVTGFYAMAQPDLPTTLDHLVQSTDVRSVLVQPHLLFAGRLYDAIVKQIEEARVRHPHIQFALTDYLGPHALVAQSVAGRIFGSSPPSSRPLQPTTDR